MQDQIVAKKSAVLENSLKCSFVLSCMLIAMTACTNVQASLAITLEEGTLDSVIISWSGSGTIAGSSSAGSGGGLDFNNFGDIFGTNIGNPDTLTLATPLTLTGNDLSLGQAYTSTYDTFQLFNVSTAGGDDVDIEGGSTSLINGDTYVASGSSLVTGLLFSDLVTGNYAAEGADVTRFGGVSLSIVAAIPEPTAFAFGSLIASCMAGLVVARHRNRVRNTAA